MKATLYYIVGVGMIVAFGEALARVLIRLL